MLIILAKGLVPLAEWTQFATDSANRKTEPSFLNL